MTLPLIRARKRPRFGLPWLAILLGIVTLIFALQGIKAVNAAPEEQLEVVVTGRHPLNISQATLDAVMAKPIKTWKPLRLLVVNRLLSADELQGRVDPGTDVIPTTAISDAAAGDTQEYRFTGVGIHPPASNRGKNTDNRFDIHNGYMNNVGIGHGPKAVAAAAQRAADALDKGPIRGPLFWLTGTAIGLALTIISLAFSTSRRKRREVVFRRLTAAQRMLAGVVLDVEALEVTYLATPSEQRTVGFTGTWKMIRDASLALARTEDAAMAWRMVDELAARPLAQRLTAEYVAEVAKLERLIFALGTRDNDIQRRTRKLLDATLGCK